ncbi:uncharacterized protein [Rutidosis leptorrhynchoides]|uniref:uncharacterized protein n=1 Tax=Rutidosis leptorrhynchoides TaxID=125765 RepID=UPI003A99F2FD
MTRDTIRDHFVHCIGNGASISAWHDAWSDYGPLSIIISNRDILHAGFTREAKLCDIVSQNGWRWPSTWLGKYPGLSNIVPPTLSNASYCIRWRDYSGNLCHFLVGIVWNAIRTRADVIDWYLIVWFPQCIPRHSFLVWLLFGENLKTQDKLKKWEVGPNVVLLCPLCRSEPDTHMHLFFRCTFASRIWKCVKNNVQFSIVGDDWTDFVAAISSFASR